jgi:CRP-like cAMP-binding protein
MRSPNRGIRALAAELIAGTEDGRLLVRDLRRTRGGLEEVKRLRGLEVQMSMASKAMASPPLHPEAVENCLTCHLRKQGWYCALSPDVLKSFNSFSRVTPHRGGELVLSRSSSGKLARRLLSWAGRKSEPNQELRIYAALTHEEMAQRIGASRETVTRLLSELRRKDLIALDGSSLVIKNRTALEAIAV